MLLISAQEWKMLVEIDIQVTPYLRDFYLRVFTLTRSENILLSF